MGKQQFKLNQYINIGAENEYRMPKRFVFTMRFQLKCLKQREYVSTLK